MTTTDYLIDSALVLLVLLQIKERPLTNRALFRPIVIVSIAVLSYLHGIPTAGNDLVLLLVLGAVGAAIGIASGATVNMRLGSHGEVLTRTGWASGLLWVLGMGSRFGFIYWITHSGAGSLASFSASHSITAAEAWTVALLGMAVFEVLGRTALLAARRARLELSPAMA